MIDKYGGEFPNHPLDGDSTISPITTVQKLYEEGEVMKHCVLLSAFRVFLGQSYVYRIEQPERCTLEIVRGDDGRWGIGEIKAFRNKEPGMEMQKVFHKWIEKAELGQK